MDTEEKKVLIRQLENLQSLRSFCGKDISCTADFELLCNTIKIFYDINSVPENMAQELRDVCYSLQKCKVIMHDISERVKKEIQGTIYE